MQPRNSLFYSKKKKKYHANRLCEYFGLPYLPNTLDTGLIFSPLSYCSATVALLFPQLYIFAGSFRGCLTKYQDTRSYQWSSWWRYLSVAICSERTWSELPDWSLGTRELSCSNFIEEHRLCVEVRLLYFSRSSFQEKENGRGVTKQDTSNLFLLKQMCCSFNYGLRDC